MTGLETDPGVFVAMECDLVAGRQETGVVVASTD